MCFDNDYDEPVACVRTETRKARKPHVCHECRAVIERGQFYSYFAAISDGKPYSLKTCAVCELTRWMIHVIELADGCHWNDSWCHEDLYYYAREYNVPPVNVDTKDAHVARTKYTVAEGQRFMLFDRQRIETLVEMKASGVA